jgi:hypothetical protein
MVINVPPRFDIELGETEVMLGGATAVKLLTKAAT